MTSNSAASITTIVTGPRRMTHPFFHDRIAAPVHDLVRPCRESARRGIAGHIIKGFTGASLKDDFSPPRIVQDQRVRVRELKRMRTSPLQWMRHVHPQPTIHDLPSHLHLGAIVESKDDLPVSPECVRRGALDIQVLVAISLQLLHETPRARNQVSVCHRLPPKPWLAGDPPATTKAERPGSGGGDGRT